MVELFDLTQTGAAKYAGGIFDRGEDWIRRDPGEPRAENVTEEFLSASQYPELFEKVKHTVG